MNSTVVFLLLVGSLVLTVSSMCMADMSAEMEAFDEVTREVS